MRYAAFLLVIVAPFTCQGYDQDAGRAFVEAQAARAEVAKLRQEVAELQRCVRLLLDSCPETKAALARAEEKRKENARAAADQARAQLQAQRQALTVKDITAKGEMIIMADGRAFYVHPAHQVTAKGWQAGAVVHVQVEGSQHGKFGEDFPTYRVQYAPDKPSILICEVPWK